jgi:hypothetical protein
MTYKELYERCWKLNAEAPNVDEADLIIEVYTNLEWMGKDKAAFMWANFGIKPFRAMLPAARQAAEAYKVWQAKNMAAEAANERARLASDEASKAYDDWKKLQ